MITDSTPLFGFISTGEKVAMYTLRIMFQHKMFSAGETHYVTRPEFIKILSNDKAKAEAAAEYICNDYGVEFRGNAEFELNEIRRKRDEESKAAKEEFERAIQAKHDAEVAEFDRQVKESVFIVGKYTGKTAQEVYDLDLGYIFWLNDQDVEGISPFNANIKIAKEFVESTGVTKPGFVGVEGEPIELELTLKSVGCFQSMYGVNYVFTSYTKNNEIVTFFSSAKKFLELENGDTYTITGTVKAHNVRNDMKQTLINKPKMSKMSK
jgi:hypothetical protein